jgi:hypothetical protein
MAERHRALGKDFALILVFAAAAVPAQDRCFNALPLVNGFTSGNNVAATLTGSDPVMPCGNASKDVWYSYSAPCTGIVTVNTCSPATTFDTVLAAWEGSCGCNALVLLACNDDFCGTRSQIVFTAAAGTVYYVSVAGFNGASGSFTLSVACAPGVPTNDECAGAIQIPIGRRIIGTNVGATQSGVAGCGVPGDVWYTFMPPLFGPITVTTCNGAVGGVTNFDTVIGAYYGTCGALTLVPSACNDDACATQSSITFGAGGGPIFIKVGGFAGATGTFGLEAYYDVLTSLSFWDQGPGTIGFRITGSQPYYYLFATLNAGMFPNGWFYGIDLSIGELTSELNAGYPFQGPLSVCGVNGPFGPLPSGLSVYAVVIGATSPGSYPHGISLPVSFTVP